MPITFSEQFNIGAETLEKHGVFDVILDVDTRVFVDPALLDICTIEEFSNAKEKVTKFFTNIITVLSHSKRIEDQFWKKADKLLTFKEVSWTCFGYSKDGTSGNAIGPVLRKKILYTLKELIVEGESDPVLFELLGVFQENIGCDRISDLVTFVLRENIFRYTQKIIEECELPSIKVRLGKDDYKTCIYPFNDKPLLLLPAVILSPLPVVEDFDDIDMVCRENQRVRDEINSYIYTCERKDATDTSCKIVTTLSVNLDADYSKIKEEYNDYNENENVRQECNPPGKNVVRLYVVIFDIGIVLIVFRTVLDEKTETLKLIADLFCLFFARSLVDDNISVCIDLVYEHFDIVIVIDHELCHSVILEIVDDLPVGYLFAISVIEHHREGYDYYNEENDIK